MDESQHLSVSFASFALSLAAPAFGFAFRSSAFLSFRVVAVAALALGVVGLVREGRGKLFAVLGTALSALELLGFAVISGVVRGVGS